MNKAEQEARHSKLAKKYADEEMYESTNESPDEKEGLENIDS